MMRAQLMFILVTLNACTSLTPIPTVSELDWNPPRISATGCPDLSGTYFIPARDKLSAQIPLGVPSSPKLFWRDKDLDVTLTIVSKSDGVSFKGVNARDSGEFFLHYDDVMVGCHDGVLVSRFIGSRGGGGESGACTFFTYGERRTSLNQNGDIQVVYNQRERCGTFGAFKTLPVTIDYSGDARPYVFRRVK